MCADLERLKDELRELRPDLSDEELAALILMLFECVRNPKKILDMVDLDLVD